MDSGVRVRGRLHRGSGLGGLVERKDGQGKKKVKGQREEAKPKKKKRERETEENEERRDEGMGRETRLLPNEVRVRTACLSKRPVSVHTIVGTFPSFPKVPRPRFAICSSMASKPARQTLGDP
jgi:hypothetical protein